MAVVIPTLNRLDDLERCLDGVARQTVSPGRTVVVDNGSTDGTREHLEDCEGVDVLLLTHNAGAPGGFQAGIDRAFASGAQWAWLLDDDAVPEPDALQLLLERLADEPKAGGAVPTVRFGEGRQEAGWRWGPRAADASGQDPNTVEEDARAPYEDVDWGPFAGLMIARNACEAVGAIRADYVLWHADVEYCLRIRAAGFLIVAAPRAVVHHPAMPTVSRTVLGRTVTVGRIQPWREYYDVRNAQLLTQTLAGTGLERQVPIGRRAWTEASRAVAVVVADPAGPRRLWMRCLGLVDGVRGRLDRRPELRGSRR